MADLEETLESGCGPEDKKEKLKKMYDEFSEDVEDTFNEIANNIYGPFLPTLFALVSQLGVGAALDYGTFLGKMVTRNTVGGFIGSVGLAVASINGSKTLLKYAAAKRLFNSLETRQQFSEALLREVESLLNLLLSFKDIGLDADRALLGEIDRALSEIRKAALIVGRENSKITNPAPIQFSQNPVSPHNLQIAVEHIEEALASLGGVQLSDEIYDGKLEQLNQKYSLEVIPQTGFNSSVSVADPLNILNYFKETIAQIRKNHSDGGILTQEGRRILQYYIIDFINLPGISGFFKTFAAAGLLGEYVTTLSKKLPIRSSLAASFAKEGIKKSLGGVFDSIDGLGKDLEEDVDNVFSYLRLQPYAASLEFPEDTTLQLTGAEVLAAQSSVLLINSRFDSLRSQTGALKKFLTPALNNLSEVEREIESVLASERFEQNTRSDISSIMSQKVGWMGRLSLAKTLISSGIETPAYIGSGKTPVSSYDINRRFARSDEIYDRLQSMVSERLIDENGDQIETQWQKILNVANSTLNSFGFGPLALFNPKAREKAIGGLQSIRFLLREQMSEDRVERTQALVYINSVESNPLFASVIKPAWDEMLKRLSETSMGDELSKALSRGNLKTLLNAMEAGKFANNAVKEFFECGEEPIGAEDRKRIENMASIIGLDGDEAIKRLREADQQITRLTNRGKMLKIIEETSA